MKKLVLINLITLLASFAGFAQIGPGEIDNTFNSSGIGAYGGNPNAVPLDASADGNVYKSKVYKDYSPGGHKDKILIVGRLTSYNGVAREYIARLNPDGTLDTSFAATTTFGSSQYIYCVEILSNDKILIGGGFTVTAPNPSGGTITYKNMARLNSDGSLDLTFCSAAGTTRGTNGVVHAFSPIGTDASGGLFIGGDFTSYSGTACGRVIKLTSAGALASGYNSSSAYTPNGEVRTIFQQGSKLLIGGFFSGYVSNGTTTSQSRIVRVNADGSLDTTFNPGGAGATGGSDGAVFQIVATTTYIYVAGRFDAYNGTARKGFIRLSATNGALSTSFNSGGTGTTGTYSHVFCFTIQPDNKFLIGGNFTQYNGVNIPKGIARLNNNGSLDSTFLTGTGFSGGTSVYQGVAVIRDIQLQSDSKIIVGGDYTTYNGTARRMISRIKTRECPLTAVYYENTGWDNGVCPTDATNQDYYVAIVSGTCTIPTGTNVYACELDIKPGATLVVEPNASITVKGVLMNNGTFIVNDKGSLVQIKDDVVNADLGDGVFKIQRKTQPVRRYDYTYWSSPVENQTLYNMSPNTLADKYWKFNATGNNWVLIMNGAETMEAGKGYIVRAPQSHSVTTPSVFTAEFIGRPNNGPVSQPIAKSGSNKWNLLGNPYPSSLDVTAFLDDAANQTKLGGTIYLWTHNTSVDYATGNYNYVSADYLAYNKTAGTITSPTGQSFNGKVASGQSFFVESLVASGTATFSNAMRRNDGNNQFYRLAQYANQTQSEEVPVEKSRFWLNATNAAGAFHQIAVGYLNGATNGLDRDYDGRVFSGSTLTIYTIAETEKLVIQGRQLPFEDTDEIPLGFVNPTSGQITISLSAFDGLFADQDVFLKDVVTNKLWNLNKGDYTFTSAAGTFDARLTIVFRKSANLTIQNSAVQVFNSASRIGVQAEGEHLLQRVEFYDVTGKLIYVSAELSDASNFATEAIQKQNQMLLVKSYLTDGSIETRKILF